MRYFIDTEFNESDGELISIALVGEDGREIYVVLPSTGEPLKPWVAEHVTPFILGTTSHPVKPASPMRRQSAAIMVGTFLAQDPEPIVIADHPEDIARLCKLLILDDKGTRFPLPALQMAFFDVEGFDSKTMSKVPHNALWDARALQDFILVQEENAELDAELYRLRVEAPLVDMSDAG